MKYIVKWSGAGGGFPASSQAEAVRRLRALDTLGQPAVAVDEQGRAWTLAMLERQALVSSDPQIEQ